MYNYNKILTYPNGNDTLYRKEFLEVFGFTEWDDDAISHAQNELFKKHKDDLSEVFDIIKNNHKFPFELDDGCCFTFLFSWHIFDKFHGWLREKNEKILNKDESPMNIDLVSCLKDYFNLK